MRWPAIMLVYRDDWYPGISRRPVRHRVYTACPSQLVLLAVRNV